MDYRHLFPTRTDVKSGGMTAIASVFTKNCFLIGADGREQRGTGEFRSDMVRKIFRAEAQNVLALYAWANTVRITATASYWFDFKTQSKLVENQLHSETFQSLSEYGFRFAIEIYRQIAIWAANIGAKSRYDDGLFAKIVFVAFVDKKPAIVEVEMHSKDGDLQPPFVSYTTTKLDSNLRVFVGSDGVCEAMKTAGLIKTCESQTEAASLIERYIATCIENNETHEECRRIGGRIHIGRLLESGCDWIIPPRL
jgi:hypothetical protein